MFPYYRTRIWKGRVLICLKCDNSFTGLIKKDADEITCPYCSEWNSKRHTKPFIAKSFFRNMMKLTQQEVNDASKKAKILANGVDKEYRQTAF